ncbi:DUF1508 domain-containing protein [Candidatus Izemoplasma sp. B36]|uniref:DUF1508 domain-containing protein n=1 Tax=Candidatus Izemoplasma sp. B36 TaxID=3242468 RepID=UPI003555F345
MFFFGRKKKKEAERKKQEELAKQKRIAEENRKKEEERKKQEEINKLEQEKEKKKLNKTKTTKKTNDKKNPTGKYEVYEEAKLFKYRLKASNGEILVVSFGYATRKGAKSGIETFKKAVNGGNFEITTDKAGYSHFDLFGSRSARVIAIGEFYKTLKLAESAVQSVKNFYDTKRVIDLDEIPSKEIREEVVDKIKVTRNPNGKFVLEKEGKYYLVKLLASNAQVLLVSQRYASKQSALNGLEVIKKAIAAKNFTIYKDKQNRYQYNLYSVNKQLIVSGETYPVKNNCISSIFSVVRFAEDAKLVEKI